MTRFPRIRRWLGGMAMSAVLGAALSGGTTVPPGADPVARGRAKFHDGEFGSPYRTAIPYALYVAMMDRYPGLLAKDWEDFRARYGLLASEEEGDPLPVGFVLRRDALSGTPFLMTNCALCHQGEVAGRRIEGIGNRNLRLNALNNALMQVARQPDFTPDAMVTAARNAADRVRVSWSWRSGMVTRKAVGKLQEMARAHVELEAGPGRNTPIEFSKVACAVPVAPPHGYVKFPAIWMYKQRGSFGYDGSLQGDTAMTVASVEFNKGMKPRAILSQPQTWRDLYQYMLSVESPRYPGTVDPVLVAAGREVFMDNCRRCHGGEGRAYPEKIVPLDEIGTDPDRVRAVTAELVAARNRTPLAASSRLVQTGGYVCPPLDGIWARAPYLHNGSVPSLVDMLLEPERRPAKFAVGSAAKYDLERVGLAGKTGPDAAVFDTRAPGNSNQGHDYGTDLEAAEKRALLEYLKTR